MTAGSDVKWATAISRETALEEAALGCARAVLRDLGPGPVSLALVFATPHFAGRYGRLHALLRGSLGAEVLLGCSGGGVIGGGEEVEDAPALSLTAARLPGVRVRPFRATERLPDLDGPPGAWEDLAGARAAEDPQFVILADPFYAGTPALLAGLDYAFPASPKIGGLASGGTSAGSNALFLDDGVLSGGAVGVALCGDVAMDTVVAQGCRPVGDLMRVTGCEGSSLHALDGRPALEVLRDLFGSLEGRDRRLAQRALFAGLLVDDLKEEPRMGDFLIRNLLGVDPRTGALVVGESLQEGMGLRFHVRDAETSEEDLRAVLDGYERATSRRPSPSGALLFSCLGRGRGLYGSPNFDTGLLRERLGDVPVGGFFCNGEIGPVGGSTFLHGYTSSFGIFRPTP